MIIKKSIYFFVGYIIVFKFSADSVPLHCLQCLRQTILTISPLVCLCPEIFMLKKKYVWRTLLSGMLHYFTMPWALTWGPLPLALLWQGIRVCTKMQKEQIAQGQMHHLAQLIIHRGTTLEEQCSTIVEYSLVAPLVWEKPPEPKWIMTGSAGESQQAWCHAEGSLHTTISPQCQFYFGQIQAGSKGSPSCGMA